MIDPPISRAELQAVLFARDLVDGEIVACGLAAAVPLGAMRLAQAMHAPNLTIAIEGGMNPRPAGLVSIPVDPRAHAGAESTTDLEDMLLLAESGKLDVWFMAGIQTDVWGNVNLHCIGNTRTPTMRGPGIGNAVYATKARRWYNYSSAHSPRSFVERVDFVTGLGNEGGTEARKRRGVNYGEGCRFVATDLGVLDFARDTGRMRLRHTHPGVSVDRVMKATGFRLDVADDVSETPMPTREEIETLRGMVDPTGVLRRTGA